MVSPVPSQAVLQYLLSSEGAHPHGGFLQVSGSSAIVPPELVVIAANSITTLLNRLLIVLSGGDRYRAFGSQESDYRRMFVFNRMH